MALNTLTFTSTQNWIVPNGIYLINDVFVVGGGGGGGSGGGGGGGQYNFGTNYATSPGSTINVYIGLGGASGASGQTSSFGTVSAGGGNAGAGPTVRAGASGSFTGGNYGYVQGITGNPDRYTGGGGAGNAQNGQDGAGFPGSGGNGYLLAWNGVQYGGGGGGAANYPTQVGGAAYGTSAGGVGGGGYGYYYGGQSGGANTGGGGGGGGVGGSGGTGIVIIRYYDPTYTLTADKSGIGEGDTINVRLQTSNVANGSVVPYTLSGSGITNSDFASNSLTGSFTITSNDNGGSGFGTVSITLVNDSTTEGNEIVTLSLNNGGATFTFLVGDSSIAGLTNVTSKTISQADYNNIRNKVVAVLGTGSGNSGWGQTILSSAVAEGNTVSVNDWGKLKYDIINAWIHLYGTIPSLATPSVGNTVIANALTAPYAQYDTYANVVQSNRLDTPAGGQYITRSSPPSPRNEVWSGSFISSWTSKLASIVSVSWTTADQARYFFNAGGQIRLQSTRSGGASTPQNNAWTTILANSGMITFGGAQPSPIVGGQLTNFYKLTNSFQTVFVLSGSTPYSSNTFRISARSPGVANNSTGTASSIELYVEWTDDHAGNNDIIDGVITLAVSTLEPSGILQPTGTGYFAVETPVINTVSIGPA